MAPRGVTVTCEHKLLKCPIRSSGVLLLDGTVLISGTLLLWILEDEKNGPDYLNSFLETVTGRIQINRYLREDFRFSVLEHTKNGRYHRSGDDALVLGAWKCPLLRKSIDNVFDGWLFAPKFCNDENCRRLHETMKDLMSVFMFAKIRGEECAALDVPGIVQQLALPARGDNVIVESTPFGQDFFANSISRGIICNVVGEQDCMFLTDAKTVLGCEGAPVFLARDSRSGRNEMGPLTGIMNCSFALWHHEWSGLSIGVSLLPVLRRFLLPTTKIARVVHERSAVEDRKLANETVVLVMAGSTLGSGVVVDAASGVIITCSHVLKEAPACDIRVFHKGNHYSSDLVYKTPVDAPYDFAIIKVSSPGAFSAQMEMDDAPVELGKPVIAVGFSYFFIDSNATLRPTMVHGCVSKMHSCMIHTTCCVHYGASGGAVISGNKLIGLIVCHMKDTNANNVYPHLSMILPVTVFYKFVKRYVETGDVNSSIDIETEEIRRLWKGEHSKL